MPEVFAGGSPTALARVGADAKLHAELEAQRIRAELARERDRRVDEAYLNEMLDVDYMGKVIAKTDQIIAEKREQTRTWETVQNFLCVFLSALALLGVAIAVWKTCLHQEGENGPNIDWQEPMHRGILRGLRNISETP